MAISHEDRYANAAHAMQAGVQAEMDFGISQAHTPKQLRVGVNSSMVETSALVKLLVDKKVLTMDEWLKAIAEDMEQEASEYEERLTKHFGKPIKLA